MSQVKPKSTFLLVFLFTHCLVHATDVLYETVFLVGPEPQPIVLDMADILIDGGATNAHVVLVNNTNNMPVSSDLLPKGSDGRRKLNARRTSLSPDASIVSPRHVRRRNEAISAQVSRSLDVGECRITNTLLGLNFDDNEFETGTARPPTNPMGAVGASRLVAVGNSMMEVRQKDGTLKFRDSFQDFFSAKPASSDSNKFFQPKVIYDEHEGRFVLVVIQQVDSLQESRIWLAVSKDETPDVVSDWNQVFIDSSFFGGSVFVDNLGFEVDEKAGYISVNTFRFSDSGSAGVRFVWFDKGVSDGFYDGASILIQVKNPFATSGIAATTVPAQVHGSNGVGGSLGTFFVTVILKDGGQVDLQILTLFDPLGTTGRLQ
jgi:hypothetical protein